MSVNHEEVRKILNKTRAVITNSHVVYTSRKHGSAYINKDAVYPHTMETSRLCKMVASEFSGDNIDVVIAPAVGGVILSQWTAHHISSLTGYEVLGVYAEKEIVPIPDPENKERSCYVETGNFVIKRCYDKLISGKRVLVVEDIINTGGSVKKTILATRKYGGTVVGVGALCNRGGITAQDLSILKFVSLMEIKLDAWDENTCPLCKDGVPINVSVGKGREFLERKRLL